MTNTELIDAAASVLNPYTTQSGHLIGDVGAALLSETGNLYKGVCADGGTWGFCAERSAMAAMITHGEYRIAKIVAVWRNEDTGKLHVMPPCGYCRQFMRTVNDANLDTEVVLGRNETKALRDLLPYHAWPPPLD